MAFALTHFERDPSGPIGKSIDIEDGKLAKRTLGKMTHAIAKVRKFERLADLAGFFADCKAGDSVCYGLPPHPEVAIRTKNAIEKLRCEGISEDKEGRPLCARDGHHFSWNEGPGILMLDYDPQEGHDLLTKEQFISQILDASPDLQYIPSIWAASSSSYIVNQDTEEELAGLRGQRLYIPVDRAKNIPLIGQNLAKRLWLNGHGHIQLSASGNMLQRCSIDQSVWQPERLDFVGGPYCKSPLVLRRPSPEVING